MTLSMYQASVPAFLHGFTSLSAILDKAEAHAKDKGFDAAVLVNARLFPDMFPLSRQVQIASDVVKGGIARLAGAEVPSYADTEASFADLRARIAKTAEFISGFGPAQIDGTEEKEISLTVGGQPMKFKGQAYLLSFVVPNFYFHITTTYSILRNNGVAVGKKDFLGNIQ